ncbi:MAG: GIY-YIG nuclease family protein [Bacteroidetes bacterium]|nr:GIY-YIG nuclease family protein [Bacteroidota bacterium]
MYILRSKLHGRYYAGSTKEVTNRVQEHNNGECKSTRNGIPWELVRIEEFRTRAEAVRKEKQVKARGIGRYLEDIKNSG